MPGTGFGFPSYPQRPALNPQDVGALLRQQAQPAAEPMMDPSMMPGVAPAAPSLSDNSADDIPIGGSEDVPSAVTAAAREATARGPAATMGTQRQPSAPGTWQQLARLGLSPEEIEFIAMGGGIV